MQKQIVGIAIALALSGCTKRGAKIATAGWGLGLSGYNTYVIAKIGEGVGDAFGNGMERSRPTALLTASTLMMLTGGAIAIWGTVVGVHGYAFHSDASAQEIKGQRITKQRAWELTKLAAAAARIGDCEAVEAFAPQIRELDSDLYADVFSRDPAIERCAGP